MVRPVPQRPEWGNLWQCRPNAQARTAGWPCAVPGMLYCNVLHAQGHRGQGCLGLEGYSKICRGRLEVPVYRLRAGKEDQGNVGYALPKVSPLAEAASEDH